MCALQRSLRSLVVVSLMLHLIGCGREPLSPAAVEQAGSPSPPIVSPQLAGQNAEQPSRPTALAISQPATRFPKPGRIAAIGDVHGDLVATRSALKLAGVLGEDGHWAGGKTVLVQTGDQLDRGDDEQEILDLFIRLEGEAKRAGGAVHVLNGNHELMNAAGDFRYVTHGGLQDFADAPGVDVDDPRWLRVSPEQRARAAAFLPGGAYAQVLAARNVAVVVGDSVFVHGGVLPKYAGKLEALNGSAQRWLRGEAEPDPDLLAEDGLVWTRTFSETLVTAEACAQLEASLAVLKARRMVVGHTVQKTGVTSACDEKVWRIDVGMAKHYGGSPAVLEILGDKVRVLTEPS